MVFFFVKILDDYFHDHGNQSQQFECNVVNNLDENNKSEDELLNEIVKKNEFDGTFSSSIILCRMDDSLIWTPKTKKTFRINEKQIRSSDNQFIVVEFDVVILYTSVT